MPSIIKGEGSRQIGQAQRGRRCYAVCCVMNWFEKVILMFVPTASVQSVFPPLSQPHAPGTHGPGPVPAPQPQHLRETRPGSGARPSASRPSASAPQGDTARVRCPPLSLSTRGGDRSVRTLRTRDHLSCLIQHM